MAKHVILESYTFTPSTRTVVVTGKHIRSEQLLLITNTKTGNVIYNFSDPSLGATSHITAMVSTTGTPVETTTIVLAYNTAAMTSTDTLAILVEETYTEIMPAEVMRDPVDKLRVSNPQSLIDTDFEYGIQPTKWESISLLNNRPSVFVDYTQPLSYVAAGSASTPLTFFGANTTSYQLIGVSVVIATRVLTLTILNANAAPGISVGTPFFLQGTYDVGNADGWWIAESVTSSNPVHTITCTVTTAPTPIAAVASVTGGTITSAALTSTITGIASTAGLIPGMLVTKTSGTGVFGAGTYIASVDSATQITVIGAAAQTAGAIVFSTTNTLFDTTKTYLFIGTFFSNAAIPMTASSTSVITFAGGLATVTTINAHGLQVGNAIYISNTTGVTGINSSWVVTSTPTTNSFTFTTALTGTVTTHATLPTLYPRALGYVQHRAFDGGVQFTNNSPYQGYQVIRQTRRYFRYQSGKGIQFSTGSILKPSLTVDNVTSSGTVATVTTKFAHGLMVGANVIVSGCFETGYNGIFAVASAATPTTFTYNLTVAQSSPATGFPITISPYSWYGSCNRIGMFDSQNGFYFEFDGQSICAVKRSSTLQLSGTVTVTNAVSTPATANTVTGVNTKFSSQLKSGDWIVIRGKSYLVQAIASDTIMYIYPEYRGVPASAVTVSKTVNTRFIGPNMLGLANTWNIDKCDGTGASKFNLDLTKMQMFYADYTWYGAGAIRFGFKNNRGEVTYCHRIPNNNINTEAYMRSGNLPARYETNTLSPWSFLTSSIAASGTTTFTVNDATGWPTSGTVIIAAAANTAGAIEHITYTRSGNVFTIGARAQLGGAITAQAFTLVGVTTSNPGGTAPIQVELHSPQFASVVSHWGSSVIMDGKFDDDKSFVFNFGPIAEFVANTIATRYPLISIRLSPTVDNGVTGLLGVRELINRMQLTLRGIDCYTTGSAYKIELILNGRQTTGTGTWVPVGGSSLAQVITHAVGDRISGGENVYGFFTNLAAATSQDLSLVRDLGNSILGGGTSSSYSSTTSNIYPDGPDIITVCATPIVGTNGKINPRISWTEAQA